MSDDINVRRQRITLEVVVEIEFPEIITQVDLKIENNKTKGTFILTRPFKIINYSAME